MEFKLIHFLASCGVIGIAQSFGVIGCIQRLIALLG